MSVKGYLVFVPFENVASMEFRAPEPDKVSVATTPGKVAGPFEVVAVVPDVLADSLKAALEAAGVQPDLPPDDDHRA